MKKDKGYKLRTILGLLVIGSVIITAIVGGYLAYSSNSKSLTKSYLDNNYQYAKKLSSNASDILAVMQNNISYIAEIAGQESFTQRELDISFRGNDQYFNSIVIANSDREVRYISPGSTGVEIGTRLTSEASLQASVYGKAMISKPYQAVSGRLILLITSPIYNEKGKYIGFVGGTIYLQEDNVLSNLFMEHFYGNGSYVYVADQEGRLIYHPQKERINEVIKNNEVINKAISGKSGSQNIINSGGESFFAGYAFEPSSEWAIVSQTPIQVLKKPLQDILGSVLIQNVPLFLLILLIALHVSNYISTPLFTLAKFSEEAFDSKKAIPPTLPKISSIIYDVNQLHKSMGKYLNLLNNEIQIDGLTGLANRKTFDLTIQEYFEEKEPFALILMDLDHFKQVNDKYGHVSGDAVLRDISATIRQIAGAEHLCFRYGGEELGILVKSSDRNAVLEIAELVRKQVAEAECPEVTKGITLSVGVAFSNMQISGPNELIAMADKALYQSKEEGRNRVNFYSVIGK